MYYTLYSYKNWIILLIATKRGLSSLSLYENQDLSKYQKDDQMMMPYVNLLNQYFKGNHITDFSLDIQGTSFQRDVFKAMLEIPFGKTASYQDLAQRIGRPKAARAVGNACGSNPIMILIPCHRVIKSDGTLGGYSSDMNLKIDLLQYEKGL